MPDEGTFQTVNDDVDLNGKNSNVNCGVRNAAAPYGTSRIVSARTFDECAARCTSSTGILCGFINLVVSSLGPFLVCHEDSITDTDHEN